MRLNGRVAKLEKNQAHLSQLRTQFILIRSIVSRVNGELVTEPYYASVETNSGWKTIKAHEGETEEGLQLRAEAMQV